MAERKGAKTQEETLVSAEKQAIADGSPADLEPEKLANYLRLLEETADERTTYQNQDKLLQSLGILREVNAKFQPTIAAILLFGKKPQDFVPHSTLKLARFKGDDVTGMILDRAELYGTLDKQIEEAALFVKRNMQVSGKIEGLYREDVPAYPIVAVREAVVNAVAHRDYAIEGQKVIIRMFDDRLEVESPGGLVPPVTLDTLGQKRYSRNPILTRLMYEMRLVEEMGTGIKKIRRALSELGSPPPTFTTDGDSFTVVLPANPAVNQPSSTPSPSATVAAPSSGEEPLFQITGANRDEYFALLRGGLSERQAKGLLYAREKGRLTNKDYRSVNPDITDETARLDLVDLVDKGFLIKFGDRKGAAYLPK
jgi:ATP-dependent DNA helicase RecG